MSTESKCPFNHGQLTGSGPTNRDWWPNQLDLRILHQHTAESNPMGEDFDYAKEFQTLDLAAVKKDLAALMTDGQEAIFLPTGTPTEISDTCQLLFIDPALCASLGQKGVAFAHTHFDLVANTLALANFYATILTRPSATDWSLIFPPTASETTLTVARAHRAAAALGAPAAALAAETDLLAHLVRQLELALDASASVERISQLTTERDQGLTREKLSRDHISNLDALLAAARENVAATNLSYTEQLAAERLNALPDADEAQGRALALSTLHALAVVADLDGQRAIPLSERDVHMLGVGVLEHVREELLHGAEHDRLATCRASSTFAVRLA